MREMTWRALSTSPYLAAQTGSNPRSKACRCRPRGRAGQGTIRTHSEPSYLELNGTGVGRQGLTLVDSLSSST